MNVAKLGIEVDSSQANRADTDLRRLSKTGGGAERSIKRVGSASKVASAGMRKLALAATGFITAFASTAFLSQTIQMARPLNKALAETSTLIEGTAGEMKYLRAESQELAKVFGGNTTQQVNAFYQAISAGASSVEAAQEQVEAANKLALGGVTDVTTGVDALSTAVNAYAASSLTAAEASDAMFVAIKAGKTNAAELSNALGTVIPIASAAGVSFDELLAGAAALTTQGQSTAQAMTGLKQTIAGVLKPTSQAKEAAKALGIEFNAAALESKGLNGFLADVIEKTGGSTEAMAQLFGSVEALNAVLAFSGAGGDKFNQVLDQMANKAGATDAAVEKMAQSLDQRANAAMARFVVVGEQVGTALLTALVPAMEGLATAIEFVIENGDALASILIGLAASQIPALIGVIPTLVAGVASLTSALLGMGTAATLATGPIGIALALIAGGAAYFLLFRDNAKEAEGGLYDAEAGTHALNAALGTFHTTAAPGAGKAAVDLANNNYKLAQSALAAAEAEVAKMEAIQSAGENLLDQNPLTAGGQSGYSEAMSQNMKAAEDRLRSARLALGKARGELTRTATTVSQTMSEQVETTSNAASIALDGVSGSISELLDKLGEVSPAGGGGTQQLADELTSLGEAWEQKTRTPLEEYQRGLAELRMLLDAGAISQETFNRAVAMLKETLNGQDMQTQSPLERTIDGVSNSLSRAIVYGDNLRESLKNTFQSIAADILNSGIKQALSEVFGGGGGGGGGSWFGSFVKEIFNFEGGGYTGAGSRTGGIDGRGGMPAVVHPNETVIDHEKGQGTGVTSVNFAPVIDARGTNPEAIAQLETAVRRIYTEFDSKVHQTLRKGKNHRRNQTWQGATL